MAGCSLYCWVAVPNSNRIDFFIAINRLVREADLSARSGTDINMVWRWTLLYAFIAQHESTEMLYVVWCLLFSLCCFHPWTLLPICHIIVTFYRYKYWSDLGCLLTREIVLSSGRMQGIWQRRHSPCGSDVQPFDNRTRKLGYLIFHTYLILN